MKDKTNNQYKKNHEELKKQVYTPPKIVTYTEKEIIEQMGPAQACSPQPCSINP